MKRAFLLVALIAGNILVNTTILEDAVGATAYFGIVVLYCVVIILALLEVRNAI